MLLSHHPVEQYERTYSVCNHRVCVRCSGVLLGFFLGFFFFLFCNPNLTSLLALVLFLPLPAIASFVLYEQRKIPNSNKLRLFTGILLGITVVSIFKLYNYHWSLMIFGCIWLLALETGVILYLHKLGLLESFIEQYESSVRK